MPCHAATGRIRVCWLLGSALLATAFALPGRAQSQTYYPYQYLPPFAGVMCSGDPDPIHTYLIGCDKLTFSFGSHGGENAQVHRLLVRLKSPGWQFTVPVNVLSVQDSVTFRGGPAAVPNVIGSTPNEFFIGFLGRDPVMRAYPEYPIDISIQVAMAKYGPPTNPYEVGTPVDWQFAEWDPSGALIASNLTPEPVSAALLGTGLVALALVRARRKRSG